MTAPNQVQCQVLSKYSPDSEHTFFNVLNFPNPNLSSSYVRTIGDKLKLFSELTLMLDANDPLTKVRRTSLCWVYPRILTVCFAVRTCDACRWRLGMSTCFELKPGHPTRRQASRTTSRTRLCVASSSMTER